MKPGKLTELAGPLRRGITVTTADNWKLNLLYFPPAGDFPPDGVSPKRGENSPDHPPPILCIHGFSQNQLTWTAGGFHSELQKLGLPTYILELRGHGFSAPRYQTAPLPKDLDYRWDTTSFLSYDLPAAVEEVRSRHAGQKLILCGHSMGGILSIAYALRNPEKLSAVVALGAPLDASKIAAPVLAFGYFIQTVEKAVSPFGSVKTLPIDRIFRMLSTLHFSLPGADKLLSPLAFALGKSRVWPQLWNPALTPASAVEKMLRYADPEAMGVAGDFLRWARKKSLDFGRNLPVDYQQLYPQFQLPFVGVWGRADILAPPESGELLRQKIQSNYRKFIVISQAAHLDLIAGAPIQKVTAEIESLLHYLLTVY